MAVLLVALLPIPSKLSMSAPGNKRQRQINTDTLQRVFKLLFEHLQHVALEGVNIDCADGKVWRYYLTCLGGLGTIWKTFPYTG